MRHARSGVDVCVLSEADMAKTKLAVKTAVVGRWKSWRGNRGGEGWIGSLMLIECRQGWICGGWLLTFIWWQSAAEKALKEAEAKAVRQSA